MTETRFVNCETCGTEGVIYHGYGNDPDHEWETPCPSCNGECSVEIEVTPIGLVDLPPPAEPSEYCYCIGGDFVCHPDCYHP
jgi:hypothetical protein